MGVKVAVYDLRFNDNNERGEKGEREEDMAWKMGAKAERE